MNHDGGSTVGETRGGLYRRDKDDSKTASLFLLLVFEFGAAWLAAHSSVCIDCKSGARVAR